ncbi:hypothetical protein M409DRAFT_32940, partial [Zasmidium cellare ATCC 36951]
AQNPKNWSKIKKWMHTIIPCALAWVFALGSSIVTPAHNTMVQRLHTSSTVVVLTLSLYVFGLAFGPYLSTLGSEIFGRKSVYMICVPLYAIFMLASGLVQVLPGLLLCRFLAGVSCAPALHMGWATLSDLWSLDDQVLPLTAYVSSAFLGSTLGPVLGAYLSWEEDWRWTQYVVLCALGGCLLPVLFMQETSKKAILRRKRGESARAPLDREALSMIFVKPLKMLLEPIVALYGLYAAFNFGVLYAVYTAFPAVLSQAEHFDRGHQGLSFLGMSVGVIMALVLLVFPGTNLEKRKTFLPPSNHPPPEWRLHPSLPASILLPASLFMLGWTARPSIPWILPILAMALYALSTLTTYISTTLYVLESYGPEHGLSAVGGVMMVVFVFGGVFPLFAEGMFRGLGAGLGCSVFAFVGIVLGVVGPGVLFVFGRGLRR